MPDRVLTDDEVKHLGLEDGAAHGERVLSNEEAHALGLETPEVGIGRSAVSGLAHGAMLGFGDKAVAGWKSFAKGTKYAQELADAEGVTKAEEDANPSTYEAAKFAGSMAPALALGPASSPVSTSMKMALQGATIGGLQGAGESKATDFAGTLRDAGIGAGIGFGTGGMVGGNLRTAGMAGAAALPTLQRLEQRFATKVLDASTKPAEATLRSATGTLGALSREGSSTLRDLAEGTRPGSPLMAAEQAANTTALQTPEAQHLAEALADKARNRLPGQLGQIENARGLVQQATQDVAEAKTPQALAAKEAEMRKYANDTLLKRYLLPAATGAAAGELFGGDDRHAYGLAGMSLGLGARPMLRAISRQATNPGYAAPITRGMVSAASKLAGMAQTQPQALGKFAAPLAQAAARGADAVAATHYTLSQDPAYQALTHALAEEQQ